MTQKDKELLLKDLCARLPYGVRVKSSRRRIPVTLSLDIMTDFRLGCYIKPYLRPMSSMTEEEYVHFMSIRGMNLQPYEIQEMMSENFSHPNRMAIINTLGRYSHNIDWLNENMFDYRGLIEKGLALEAPEGMYK